jgi:hypothetical protein
LGPSISAFDYPFLIAGESRSGRMRFGRDPSSNNTHCWPDVAVCCGGVQVNVGCNRTLLELTQELVIRLHHMLQSRRL